MSYEKAYKISLIFFLMIILVAVFVTPQVEGYGGSVASVAILALSGHWIIHNVIAFKFGQIDIKGFMVNRTKNPKSFGLILFSKGLFSTLFIYLVLR
ncbi:hypothetical protein [Pseudocolwellia agarivorans]|uniref:hypothetical protein n=1 Tax=Pseudocolwellia agarivorans TaxID=1911682 RepID=UPI003F885275